MPYSINPSHVAISLERKLNQPQQNYGSHQKHTYTQKELEMPEQLYTDKDHETFINMLMQAVKAWKVGKAEVSEYARYMTFKES